MAIRGAVAVVAAATVAIVILGGNPTITGGGFTQRLDISTPAKWCEHYGAEVHDGVAVLFKAVLAGYLSPRGFAYVPGTTPEAPDWDGGKRECGGGLHFSPHPLMALEFVDGYARDKVKFVGCPVALADIVVHPDGQMPQKCKARGLRAACWEVDRHGKPVTGAVVSWPSTNTVSAAKPRKAKAPAKASGRKRVRR